MKFSLRYFIFFFSIFILMPIMAMQNSFDLISRKAAPLIGTVAFFVPSYQTCNLGSKEPSDKDIIQKIALHMPNARIYQKNNTTGLVYHILNLSINDKKQLDTGYDIFKQSIKLFSTLGIIHPLIKEFIVPSAGDLQLELRISPTTNNIVYVDIDPYLLIKNQDLKKLLIQIDTKLASWHQQNYSYSKMIMIRSVQTVGLQTVNAFFFPLIGKSFNDLITSNTQDENSSTGQKLLSLVGYTAGWLGSIQAVNMLSEKINKKLIEERLHKETKDNKFISQEETNTLSDALSQEIQNSSISSKNYEEFILYVSAIEKLCDVIINHSLDNLYMKIKVARNYLTLHSNCENFKENQLSVQKKKHLELISCQLLEKYNITYNPAQK